MDIYNCDVTLQFAPLRMTTKNMVSKSWAWISTINIHLLQFKILSNLCKRVLLKILLKAHQNSSGFMPKRIRPTWLKQIWLFCQENIWTTFETCCCWCEYSIFVTMAHCNIKTKYLVYVNIKENYFTTCLHIWQNYLFTSLKIDSWYTTVA